MEVTTYNTMKVMQRILFVFCLLFLFALTCTAETATERWEAGHFYFTVKAPAWKKYYFSWGLYNERNEPGVSAYCLLEGKCTDDDSILLGKNGFYVTLPHKGEFRISITTLKNIRYLEISTDDPVEITAWSNNEWTSLRFECKNLTINPEAGAPRFKKNASLVKMFKGCKNFNADINHWDVQNVVDMFSMFYECENFNSPLDHWDVSNVRDMGEMFYDCKKFNSPLDHWDVHNVVNMNFMFRGCTSFNGSLGHWDVSNVKDAYCMFKGCKVFNQPLPNWDFSNAKRLAFMFEGAKSLNSPLDGWKLCKDGVDVSYMFLNCSNFNQSLNSWSVGGNLSLVGMFEGCEKFNQPLDSWDVSQVTDMADLFNGCHAFNQSLEHWNVNAKGMSRMFKNAKSFNQPVRFNVKNTIYMTEMFCGATHFNQPLNDWDVSSVESMRGMFASAKSFNQPLDNWDVSRVSSMDSMFYDAKSFNQSLGFWSLQGGVRLGLQRCGMDIDNYSKSLIGWLDGLRQRGQEYNVKIDAVGLSYSSEGRAARGELCSRSRESSWSPSWSFYGDRYVLYYVAFKKNDVILQEGRTTKLRIGTGGCDEENLAELELEAEDDNIVEIIDEKELKIKGVGAGSTKVTVRIPANKAHDELESTCIVTVEPSPKKTTGKTPSTTTTKKTTFSGAKKGGARK